ncbi:MAG: M24 family metallopeptidase [Phycisphaerae bacterium]|nr:aminopeptidase P family protein [Phycisphaerae bacterium]NIP52233.1 aminopeptidase P family protein [Phycisphaerae bacterium]NIS49796.1 aminopeptidase P family protein [Phycisphaerae bacterium]NIU07535.1 aminopeptidase P family protein [Phycisphaerae bacterium]NIU59743.1 M24 family metallopeptidase [Phycisphaerae bacterium]
MFSKNIYIERRKRLRDQIGSGIILLLGNEESPMNYPDNPYPFRQDSCFLYFIGLDYPGLAAVIDVDEVKECVFGDDITVNDIIWMGPQPSLKEKCQKVGISETAPLNRLQEILKKAVEQNRRVHFLPQYRAENTLKIERLLGIHPSAIKDEVSETLIKAVAAQRSIKTEGEIAEIETALDISYEMQTLAMKMSKSGIYEREIVGAMEGLVLSRGSRLSFPTIFSVHGETLHNHYYGNQMKEGDIAVNDSGAESLLHYASDITRTIPVSGKFSQRQKEIYAIVLNAQEKAIEAVRPGVEFRNVHKLAYKTLGSGLKDLGLMKGVIEEAVDAGAVTLFFQCGLGHMMGLDTHDMEDIGEDYVGYTDTIKRNPEFGWRSLRLGKELEAGFVITVEPGLYFIPELIDRWKAEKKCSDFINYDMVEKYRDFGGIRIEDDVLVTENGHRVLGKKIPKTIDEVETMSS